MEDPRHTCGPCRVGWSPQGPATHPLHFLPRAGRQQKGLRIPQGWASRDKLFIFVNAAVKRGGDTESEASLDPLNAFRPPADEPHVGAHRPSAFYSFRVVGRNNREMTPRLSRTSHDPLGRRSSSPIFAPFRKVGAGPLPRSTAGSWGPAPTESNGLGRARADKAAGTAHWALRHRQIVC
ncbi:hypothetical protein GQ53DRAFT_422130 [Thozetella sp. PMI_491]|nr:hypothetical protein GQ53DRAFT_422130 [Thozetella sp. PMI_491]